MQHFRSSSIAPLTRLRHSLLGPTLLAILFSLCAVTAHAQFRASIQGTVSDTEGAVIPGATLTLTDTDTNHVITAISNDSGTYNFNALPQTTSTSPSTQRDSSSNSSRTCTSFPSNPILSM
ncbi:carboxypeptidase-like regulatory domain-containing protein [Tunturiibacter empetritectus]|uniref:carboxypeptidase-like regulatory domain-containing protein n=1 Tax=Tunturiibacter empetritectus TaxID=3069691 RepID=UPI003D9BE820